MTNRFTKSLALAAALGVSALPFAGAHADEVKVANSALQQSQLMACNEAMQRANQLSYNPGRETRSIGSCECETVDMGMDGTKWRCMIRVNIRDK